MTEEKRSVITDIAELMRCENIDAKKIEKTKILAILELIKSIESQTDIIHMQNDLLHDINIGLGGIENAIRNR